MEFISNENDHNNAKFRFHLIQIPMLCAKVQKLVFVMSRTDFTWSYLQLFTDKSL